MNATEICMQSLTEVSGLIARREVSPVELTRAMLERIERIDRPLHAYLTVTPDRALAAAKAAEEELARGVRRGPLHGVPIGVKDLCATRGVRTTCGSAVFAEHVPDRDAAVVARLEAAGAIMLGKLNLTEFALLGYHPSIPTPRNPWDLGRDPGGSSSGPGVATAAGLCFAAIGTDTGGSIRMPSGWCGVVGLKPTYGRVSRAGVFPLAASLDHVGPMARRVGDVATVLDTIAGFDPDDPTTLRDAPPRCAAAVGGDVRGLRIGWDERFVAAGAEPDVVAATREAVRALAAQGAQVVEIEIPAVDSALSAWPVLCGAEAAAVHAATYPSRAADYGPTFVSFLEYAATLTARDIDASRAARREWVGRLPGVFERVDVLACPSTFMNALPAELMDSVGPFTPEIARFMRFTAPFNFSGNPTLSLPCGFDANGLPYSLQLVGRHGEEALLCRVGHAYEAATPWHQRHPPGI